MTSPCASNGLQYSAPISVFLNLTQQCNLRCVYCIAEVVAPSHAATGELSDAEMLALVDRLIDVKVFRFVLTGGEPFVRRPLLYQILDRVTASRHALLFTNGTLISREDVDRLAPMAGRLAVFVSIDAPEERVNAVTRGRGVLGKTLRTVDALLERGLELKVNCVVNRLNVERVPELVALLKAHGVAELHLNHLQPLGFARGHAELGLDLASRREFWRTVAALAAAEPGIRFVAGDADFWEGYEESLARLQARGRIQRAPGTLLSCSAGMDQCAITPDGWVVPCNSLFDYRCGNIRTRDILDIWQRSPELQRFRTLRYTQTKMVPGCDDCRFSVFCRGGCRALAFEYTAMLTGRDPTCPYYGAPLNRSTASSDAPSAPCVRP